MASLSDAELRRRLEAHNFAAPPVTGSTRPLLLKKLAQLDGDNQKSTKGSNMATENETNHEDTSPKIKVRLEDEPTGKWGISSWITYSSIVALMLSYCVFLYDRNLFHSQVVKVPGLTSLETLFDAIEKYSPFHEFLMDENDYPGKINVKESEAKQKTGTAGGIRLLTTEELKSYDGSEGSPGLYIALLGQVFDVSKGKEHYGPGGGYSFFAAKDGSRAFVTGEFNEDGLIDDVTGLDTDSYLGLEDWVKFYHKDYTYVGNLAGRFYDRETGEPTEFYHMLLDSIAQAKEKKAQKQDGHQIFPPCNSEWSQEKGHRVWCTKLSGGIKRNWVGVPRRLFTPGQTERCACVKEYGDSLSGYDGSDSSKPGDLGHPNLKEYEGCNKKATSCKLS